MALSSFVYPVEAVEVEAPTIQSYPYPLSEWVDIVYEKASTTEIADLAIEIIKRESGGWNVCNAKLGCNAGQGLMQIIPSTEMTCEEYFDREMDMLYWIDNLDCGLWLLDDGSGITHWWDKEGKWGSGPYDVI